MVFHVENDQIVLSLGHRVEVGEAFIRCGELVKVLVSDRLAELVEDWIFLG